MTEALNASLIYSPTQEEIKKACFSIHPDKAPDPEDFSASFFQTNWDVIGVEIIKKV